MFFCMSVELDEQVEAFFTRAKNKIDKEINAETFLKNIEMEVRVFGQETIYNVFVKARTSTIDGDQGGTIIYKEEVKDPELAFKLGDRFSQYLVSKGHKCSVDLTYLSDEGKRKLGIPIKPKT